VLLRMKINKWKITVRFLNPFLKGCYIYLWGFNFNLFQVYISDLNGFVTFFNVHIKWEKLFK